MNGSPRDRGEADSYYGRLPKPHCCKDGRRVEESEMNKEDISEYYEGYDENTKAGIFDYDPWEYAEER